MDSIWSFLDVWQKRLARPRVAIMLAPLLLAGLVLTSGTLPGVFVALIVITALAALGAGYCWPAAALTLIVLTSLVEHYLLRPLLPTAGLGSYGSELLLLTAGSGITLRAWRAGRLSAALRHPTLLWALAFVAAALLAAGLNAVPPQVAAAGLFFTLDAVALFFLARLAGFTLRTASAALGTLLLPVLTAALLAIGQVLLAPDILGLYAITGRSGEQLRTGGFIPDVNVFGTLLGMIVPVVFFTAARHPWRRGCRIAAFIGLLLLIALLLSFSRGAWLGVMVGFGGVALLLDRRTALLAAGTLIVAFGIVTVMPRGLLTASPADGPAPTASARPDIIGSTGTRLAAIGAGTDLRTLFVLNAIPILRDYPLLGVGPGRYGGAVADNFGTPVYEQYDTDALFSDERQDTVDNFWLHITIEGGLLGAATFVGMLAAPLLQVLRSARRVRRKRDKRRFILLAGAAAATAMLAVSSLTTMMLEGNTAAFTGWFMLGIASALALPAETPSARPKALTRQPLETTAP